MAKMVETISTVNSAIRTVLILLLIVAICVISWYAYTTYHEQELRIAEAQTKLDDAQSKIGNLEAEKVVMQKEIEQLMLRLKLLKVDRRLAQITVTSQKMADNPEEVKTTFSFVEVDKHGQQLSKPQEFTVDGDMIFINSKVVKFDDELIEANDPLRSTSICLIEKIYGEYQKPAEGFEIDEKGNRPKVYGIAEEMTDYEKEIWDNFWEISNDPEKAEEYGIRAAHEESPSIKAKQGKRYQLEIRSSGGTSLITLPDEQSG